MEPEERSEIGLRECREEPQISTDPDEALAESKPERLGPLKRKREKREKEEIFSPDGDRPHRRTRWYYETLNHSDFVLLNSCLNRWLFKQKPTMLFYSCYVFSSESLNY